MTEQISIHALLAESDRPLRQLQSALRYFYPRSPCGERRWLRCWQLAARDISIHALLAESDNANLRRHCSNDDFYPRSPCGERQANLLQNRRQRKYFYPRSPCGERRSVRPETRQPCAISIHALLAESDTPRITPTASRRNFYPRSPCGERLYLGRQNPEHAEFLSTLSLRRATVYTLELANTMLFLSTLSLRRATRRHRRNHGSPIHFYPRSPCGERPLFFYAFRF